MIPTVGAVCDRAYNSGSFCFPRAVGFSCWDQDVWRWAVISSWASLVPVMKSLISPGRTAWASVSPST